MTNPAPLVPDTSGPDQLRRSIDSLQRLYTIVVGLAVTEALRGILTPLADRPWREHWPALLMLLITVIPFYHGANAHLDQTYLYGVDGKRREKKFALVVDFFVLFIEGVLFFVLALTLKNFDSFIRVFLAILLVDVLWAVFVHISGDKDEKTPHAYRWGVLNAVAAVVIYGGFYSTWFSPEARTYWVAAMAVARLVIDYWWCWDFYVARFQMPASADRA